MLPRHGFADACPQNPPGYPHPCRFQRKKQARGYGGFAPIYDAQHLLIHFSTDLSTLRTDYAHCKTAIPPQPSAPQGCKRTAAEISVQLVRGVPTPFRRFAAWNRFGHQGTFSRKRPLMSKAIPRRKPAERRRNAPHKLHGYFRSGPLTALRCRRLRRNRRLAVRIICPQCG